MMISSVSHHSQAWPQEETGKETTMFIILVGPRDRGHGMSCRATWGDTGGLGGWRQASPGKQREGVCGPVSLHVGDTPLVGPCASSLRPAPASGGRLSVATQVFTTSEYRRTQTKIFAIQPTFLFFALWSNAFSGPYYTFSCSKIFILNLLLT